jgi:hypothetical protein
MCSFRFLASDCGNFDGQLGEFFTKVVLRIQHMQTVAAEIVRQPKLELCSSQSKDSAHADDHTFIALDLEWPSRA